MKFRMEPKWLYAFGLVFFVWILFSIKPIGIQVTGITPKTISVSGQDSIKVTPDKVEASIYVYTEGTNVTAVQLQNNQIMNHVISALEGTGINVSTTSYTLSPKTSYNSSTGQSSVYGYSVTHVIKATSLNTSKAGSIVDTAISNGANGVSSVTFTLSKSLQDSSYNQVLTLASKDAYTKASALARSMGLWIFSTQSVSESNVYYGTSRDYATALSAAEGAAPAQITPEDIDVSATIGVSYLVW